MTRSTQSSFAEEVRRAFEEEAAELLRRIELAINALASADASEQRELWLDVLRALHTLKGAAAASGEEATKQYTHALEERVRHFFEGEQRFSSVAAEELHQMLSSIHAAAGLGDAVASRAPSAPPAEPLHPLVVTPAQSPAEGTGAARVGAGRSEPLRVKAERVDALQSIVGELAVTRLQHEAVSQRMLGLRDEANESLAIFRRLATMVERTKEFVPQSRWEDMEQALQSVMGVMDHLLLELGEVLRDVPMIDAQAAALGTALEDGVRSLRLMPLQPFFEEYAKVVREASRECGKPAQLVIQADGAEVDRGVLARLREPLLHLVRNAVVHGLEPAEIRRAMGKPLTGTVRLEAHCEGSRAVIRVLDDGNGIDVARVREKALATGMLIDSGELEDDKLLEILAHPGFSTRSSIDGLAGRGIGLDVVANSVGELDGRLALHNLPGAGSSFTIDVPIAASTSSGLVAKVGEHSLGILLNHVERVIRFSTDETVEIRGREAVLIDGEPIAIVNLSSLIGIDAPPILAAKRPAIVLRSGRHRLVVVVDDIPGQQALIVRPLGRAFAKARLFAGGAIQPDGSVLPVLNIAALFEQAGRVTTSRIAGANLSPERDPSQVTVLVADDSFTMRTLLRNILQAARYRVVVAHDGRAALETFSQLPTCDIVITDLQMPNMDGVQLCQAIRRSDRARTPIVMVTSVGDASEKRRAVEAGADTYIVKSVFEQSYFLELVARLTGANLTGT